MMSVTDGSLLIQLKAEVDLVPHVEFAVSAMPISKEFHPFLCDLQILTQLLDKGVTVS